MEYIEGRAIDRYCDGHHLSTVGRLKLFQQGCAAVQFAHQNLIVRPSRLEVAVARLGFAHHRFTRTLFSRDRPLRRSHAKVTRPTLPARIPASLWGR
ncbi:MAG TPA: hypothetical protein VFD58_12515 [Blastocatellia bacterium]|nr:hypothetical protein [Blastocatellia bacterium]